MLYNYTYVATVGVTGLSQSLFVCYRTQSCQHDTTVIVFYILFIEIFLFTVHRHDHLSVSGVILRKKEL